LFFFTYIRYQVKFAWTLICLLDLDFFARMLDLDFFACF